MGNMPDMVTQLKSSGYGKALSDIQTELGIPADTNCAGIEALLIYMINRVYIRKPDNIDIALLGLGLLNGFNDRRDRNEPSQERDLYTERRESFFQKTDFILIKYKKKYNVSSYEEAKRTVKEVKENGEPQMVIDTIRGSFDTATSRCIEKVISSLYKKKDSIDDCLQAAKRECEKNAKEKGIKIDWHQCSHLPEELLPNLKYYQRKQIISGISCTVPDLESGISQENEGKTETPSYKTNLDRQEPVPKDVLGVSLESVKNVQMDSVVLTKSEDNQSDLLEAEHSNTVQQFPGGAAESNTLEYEKLVTELKWCDYYGALKQIRDDLGLSPLTSLTEIEALLIFATRDCLAESLDADMVLSALGLLKGFDNQHSPDEMKNSNTLVTARRRKFIGESSYVADRHGSHNIKRKVHYNSYSELEAAGEDAIKAVIDALGSEDGNLINKVAQKLYSYKSNISSYLEESKKYLDVDKDKHIIGVKLQDLIHVNKDKTPLKSNPEPQPEPQPEPKPEQKPGTEPGLWPEQYNRIRKRLNVAIATIVVLVTILCCIVGWGIYFSYKSSSKQSDLPSVEKIILSSKVISVTPGIPEELKTSVIPNKAGIDGLECEPENKNLVRVEKREDGFRVTVNKGWQEETDYTTTIKVYVKDDTDVFANATVTVELPAHISDPPPSGMNNPVLGGISENGENSSWNDSCGIG